MNVPDGLDAVVGEGVVSVTLDCADAENRVTPEMLGWLGAVLDDPPADSHVFRLSARGPVFCLGPRRGDMSVRDLGKVLIRFNRTLAASRMVTVAVVDGEAAGFGVGLACLADITLAGDAARFVLPEINQQLTPALVLSWLADYVGPKAAGWMTLTGQPIDAAEALQLGLVSRVVPSDRLDDESNGLIERLLTFDRASLLEIRRFLRDRSGLSRRAAEELAIERMGAWAERPR